ncbi:hypothetical protein [Bradyrhizobium sp. USDA 10063]
MHSVAFITQVPDSAQIGVHTVTDTIDAAWCADQAPIGEWSARDASVEDTSKYDLLGSPTIGERLFTPSPRAEKVALAQPADQPGDELIKTIFNRQLKLQTGLVAQASGF